MNYVILIGVALFFVATALRDGAMGWDFSGDSMNFRIDDGNYSLRIKADGEVDLEPDGSGVTALDRGGSFDVSMRRDGLDRRVLFTSPDGTIERQFFVEGDEQPWGPEADRFVAEVMPIVLRETAINAGERVAWLIASRGDTGLLDEIELIQSDFAQRVYSVEYAQRAEIAAANFERLMTMTVHRVAVNFSVPLQRDDRVAHVRWLDVAPVEIRRIAAHCEVEFWREALPERREGGIESADRLALRPQRARP